MIPNAWSYIIRSGYCKKNVRGMVDFNRTAYFGAWYEYANTFEIYEIGGTCVRATYTDEGEVVGVFNEQVNEITGRYGNVKGSARFANPEDPLKRGELIVGFGGFGRRKRSAQTVPYFPYAPYASLYWQRRPVVYQAVAPPRVFNHPIPSSQTEDITPKQRTLFQPSTTPNYSVIDSDYTSYSVVYTCIPIPGLASIPTKKESLWLLTREQYPEQDTVDKATEIMKIYDLPFSNIPKTDHTDCALLPAVGEAVPASTIESLGR